MHYSIEPRSRIYVNGHGYLSFGKNIGAHATKVAKNLSNKYSQKLLDSAKKSATDTIKTDSKRAIRKTVKATGYLIDNKIADKIKIILQRNCIQRNFIQKNCIQEQMRIN